MMLHTGERPYGCNICGKTFQEPSNLNKHIALHTGERPHVCNVCEKTFLTSYHLESHMKIHAEERPLICIVCEAGFQRSSNLKQHMRIHTGERPHTCKVCGKTFTSSGNLCKHMKRHVADRSHVCDVCEKAFLHSSQLQEHMRIHTGEKPHECSICGLRFRLPSHLMMHMKRHFGERNEHYKLFFQSAALEEDQVKQESGERPYDEESGEKSSPNPSSIEEDQVNIDNGEKPYDGNVFMKSFLERDQNADIKIEAEEMLECKSSVKVFPGSLKEHLRIHILAKPSECGMRSNSCTPPGSSKHHEETDMRERNFDDKSLLGMKENEAEENPLSDSASLDAADVGVVRFGCSVCDEMFADEKDFLDHCSVHLENDPSGYLLDEDDEDES